MPRYSAASRSSSMLSPMRTADALTGSLDEVGIGGPFSPAATSAYRSSLTSGMCNRNTTGWCRDVHVSGDQRGTTNGGSRRGLRLYFGAVSSRDVQF